jgi:hypothetical protein
MLCQMAGIINGRDWLKQRLQHLEAALQANPSDEERAAIQSEIDELRAEAKAGRGRFRRWVIWGGRTPEV